MIIFANRNRVAVTLAAGAVLVLLAGGADAAAGCRSANGKVRLAPVSGPECQSPVGMCFAGELMGGLHGTAFTTATSVTPTIDTAETSVVLFTANSVVTTQHGTLDLKEAVVLQSAGAGEFSELSMIVGGTDHWEGASGVLRVDGSFDGTTVTGSYTAEVCSD